MNLKTLDGAIEEIMYMDIILKLIMMEYLKFDMNTHEVRFNGLRYGFDLDNPEWDKIVGMIGGYEYLKDMVDNESGRKL